jgi:hypothetical protein
MGKQHFKFFCTSNDHCKTTTKAPFLPGTLKPIRYHFVSLGGWHTRNAKEECVK